MEQVVADPRSGTTTLSLNSKEGRRRELASFLRRRRESVAPEAIGVLRTLGVGCRFANYLGSSVHLVILSSASVRG